MDARAHRLRQVPERPRARRALRRLLPRLVLCRLVLGQDWAALDVQLCVQDVPAQVLGGADDHVREGRGLDPVDVEGGGGRRLVVQGRPRGRMDPEEPHGPSIPQHLRLSMSCVYPRSAFRIYSSWGAFGAGEIEVSGPVAVPSSTHTTLSLIQRIACTHTTARLHSQVPVPACLQSASRSTGPEDAKGTN